MIIENLNNANDFKSAVEKQIVEKIGIVLNDRRKELAENLYLTEEVINERAKLKLDIKAGAFHQWLGKPEDQKITGADIERGLKAGGHPAKMAEFAKNFGHVGESFEYAKKAANDEETIDELKKSTYANYIKKSTSDLATRNFTAGYRAANDKDTEIDKINSRKMFRRRVGIHRAVNSITQNENADQIDELSKDLLDVVAAKRHYEGRRLGLMANQTKPGSDVHKHYTDASVAKHAKGYAATDKAHGKDNKISRMKVHGTD